MWRRQEELREKSGAFISYECNKHKALVLQSVWRTILTRYVEVKLNDYSRWDVLMKRTEEGSFTEVHYSRSIYWTLGCLENHNDIFQRTDWSLGRSFICVHILCTSEQIRCTASVPLAMYPGTVKTQDPSWSHLTYHRVQASGLTSHYTHILFIWPDLPGWWCRCRSQSSAV